MKWVNLFIAVGLLITASSAKLAPSIAPNKSARPYVTHFENVLGTSLELKIITNTQREATIAENAALKEIARMGKILSAYDPTSEFSHWLKTSGQAVPVSPELFEMLSLFDQWRLRTAGALDASAQVITNLWKQAAAKNRVPTQDELSSAVAEVKQTHWKLDAVKQTATHLSHAPLMLNSFAKTYIIKHAADAAFASTKIDAIVVNIGGDLVVLGKHKETIQISDPKADAENDAPIDVLQIENKAVATSGNYRRGELIEGHWYSHIVDPRTGQPAEEVISATVVAPVATDAGALATAFNVLSPSESVQLATRIPGVDYLIITKSGRHIASEGWRALELASGPQLLGRSDPNGNYRVEPGWNNDFELVVNLEINLQKEGFAKRPYVAVWVEDENHAAVRTIAVWHERDRYLPELKSWYLKYRGLYNTDKSALSSVSSATRSPGKYTMKWDGKDDKGDFVKPGTYTIKIEASREHGTYQLMRQELECNETPKLINIPGNVEITSASLDYRKKNAGN
jgi:thiamine biosynthesis lipoprotein ApbE